MGRGVVPVLDRAERRRADRLSRAARHRHGDGIPGRANAAVRVRSRREARPADRADGRLLAARLHHRRHRVVLRAAAVRLAHRVRAARAARRVRARRAPARAGIAALARASRPARRGRARARARRGKGHEVRARGEPARAVAACRAGLRAGPRCVRRDLERRLPPPHDDGLAAVVFRAARFLRAHVVARRAPAASRLRRHAIRVLYGADLARRHSGLPVRGVARRALGPQADLHRVARRRGRDGLRVRPERAVRRQRDAARRHRARDAILPVRDVGSALHVHAGALRHGRAQPARVSRRRSGGSAR